MIVIIWVQKTEKKKKKKESPRQSALLNISNLNNDECPLCLSVMLTDTNHTPTPRLSLYEVPNTYSSHEFT